MPPLRRLLPLSFAGLVAIPLLQCQCLTPVNECDPLNCTGCCDDQGLCHQLNQQEAAYCGVNAAQCTDCTMTGQPCIAGVCGPARDGGVDSGTRPGPDAAMPGPDASCDTCAVQGARRCDPSQPNSVDVCQEAGGCLQWVPLFQCPSDSSCVEGTCRSSPQPDAGCLSDCSTLGATQCDPMAPNAIDVCQPFGACLEWASPVPCPPAATCLGGQCVLVGLDAGCMNNCPSVGATQCDPANPNAFDECQQVGGCLEWLPPISCGQLPCVNGQCGCMNGPGPGNGCADAGCTQQCTTLGAATCTGPNTGTVCVQSPDQPCYQLGSFVCAPPTVCSNGECVVVVPPTDAGTPQDAGTASDGGIGSPCGPGSTTCAGFCVPIGSGYCTQMCSNGQACPSGSTCLTLGPISLCAATCNSSGGCDNSNNVCYPFFGGVCLPNCNAFPAICIGGTMCTSSGICI
jgi:hypothetical protein